MDGNRRYEVVTSCDHLHGSHASYSDRTQMLGNNVRLYADIWMHDQMVHTTVRQAACDMPVFSALSFNDFFLGNFSEWLVK